MAHISGKYKLDSQENFGEFLEHMGKYCNLCVKLL